MNARSTATPHGSEPPGRPLRSPTVVLSDRTIREELASGRLVIDPFDEALLQPSSVDVRVADEFRVFHNNRRPFIDVREPTDDLTELVDDRRRRGASSCTRASSCWARPLERVALPDDLVARLEGKSSLGRLGLLIHSTAGYIDPGFDGTITLELSNVARLPISIHPGMAIGQISFLQMTTPVERALPAASTRGRAGPTASAFHQEFTGTDPAARPRGARTTRPRPAGRSQRVGRPAPPSSATERGSSRRDAPGRAAARQQRRRVGPAEGVDGRATAMKPAWMT